MRGSLQQTQFVNCTSVQHIILAQRNVRIFGNASQTNKLLSALTFPKRAIGWIISISFYLKYIKPQNRVILIIPTIKHQTGVSWHMTCLHCYLWSPSVEWDLPWLLPSSAWGSLRPVCPTGSSKHSCPLREPEQSTTFSKSSLTKRDAYGLW